MLPLLKAKRRSTSHWCSVLRNTSNAGWASSSPKLYTPLAKMAASPTLNTRSLSVDAMHTRFNNNNNNNNNCNNTCYNTYNYRTCNNISLYGTVVWLTWYRLNVSTAKVSQNIAIILGIVELKFVEVARQLVEGAMYWRHTVNGV
jgi:hypothetical protein